MNVVITGGRHFKDRKMMWEALNKIHQETPIERLAHGACTGADDLAREWAIENGLTAVGYPADWHIGKKAGPMRNAYMLQQEQPDLVVAFPGGRGTQNAIDFAKKMGYNITVVHENGALELKETL